MTDDQLLAAALRRCIELEATLRDGADVHAYVNARDAVAALVELQVRGTQLRFDVGESLDQRAYGADS
jgi:hypothetical protein